MKNAKPSMFNDRRKQTDRRTQNLSMPAALDRRVGNRRSKHFRSQSWWLQIEYASELVSEKLTSDEPADDIEQSTNNPFSENSD